MVLECMRNQIFYILELELHLTLDGKANEKCE